jgi:hypothetical protein
MLSAEIERYLSSLPSSPELEKIVRLARVGLAFETQQCGRKHGFIRNYVAALVSKMQPPITFERLLEEMELEAARRATQSGTQSPVETVNRVWELVTYHDPQKGRRQVTFKTLRNHLTPCKKTLIPGMR